MKNESVAVLDIRSDGISFMLGARGVNNTFVFKDVKSEKFVGFSAETVGILEKDSFQNAVTNAIHTVCKNYEGNIREVYVGVPSWAVSVLTLGHTNSYPTKRKISAQDVDALYESGLNKLMSQGKCIRRSNMYFTLGDNRKYFSQTDLYGISTTMLFGGLCYYFTSEDFFQTLEGLLKPLGFIDVYYIPSTLAQANYLFPEKKREGYAFLLDIGKHTSSVSVVYGHGIVHEATFTVGVEKVLQSLESRFEIDRAMAREMLLDANISGGAVAPDLTWQALQEDKAYSVAEINEEIKRAVDELCEKVDEFFNEYYKERASVAFPVIPIAVTGDGVGQIKGLCEHISRRLGMLTEVTAPDLPYYDKPQFSSVISLLDMALSDKKQQSWIYKIFNIIGGKRK